MTHDELLEKIDEYNKFLITYSTLAEDYSTFTIITTLRAVVELHKPDESDFPDEWENCVECSGNGYSALYPCDTIKAIEKELR